MNTQRICCAGFGGQGTLSMGKILAYAGMLEGHEVSWCPSYGPEMRGGTANCHVIVSDEPIGSPVITSDANCVIAMNQPSLDKFVDILGEGGVLIANADLAALKEDRSNIRVMNVPANSMATQEFGSAKLANIILLGAVIQATGSVKVESIDDAFAHVFGGAKAKFIPNNKKAFEIGFEFAKNYK
ncbi:2-oxoacid:acceptor oxidoreductase family protein [Anaerotignum sp.]|uniref:2-oxoacid:acceptor oxidoreductase family protein n=1 Tax=Anaerotignum sp. TaxID=2039241 RepID=UPI002899DC15|nr:2-oxoacid:acceptor oxidoreductase family protein [Anaerotignum sp.]